MARRMFTEEEIEFIKATFPGRTRNELADLFAKRFGDGASMEQVSRAAYSRGITNGWAGNRFPNNACFKKGHKAWNKGKKGITVGGKETQFKKGQKPWSHRPVGSERIQQDGYVYVKVAEPKDWRPKHRVVWEAAHGPIPEGHVIVFADMNRTNCNLDNLLLVSREKLAVMNKRGLVLPDARLTKAGMTIADIHMKIAKLRKK